MQELLSALVAQAGEYVGNGVNHEKEPFVGTLRVEPLVNGSAALLHYSAVGLDGSPLHSEATLLANAPSGLCLWPVMQELPFVLPHAALDRAPSVPPGAVACAFASGPRERSAEFREELTIVLQADGVLVYAHAWGLPGGEFSERSSCAMRKRVA